MTGVTADDKKILSSEGVALGRSQTSQSLSSSSTPGGSAAISPLADLHLRWGGRCVTSPSHEGFFRGAVER